MPPRPRRSRPCVVLLLALLLPVGACEPPGDEPGSEAESEASAEAGVLPITAKDFEFEAPEEIPSGWTTIRFSNVGEQEHFAYLYRLPDDVTFGEYGEQVGEEFVRVWNRYDSGELTREEAAAALGAAMPEWYFTGVTPSGGAALTEPGETSRTTVRLEPGTYVIECYVKTPQGTWHTERGMVKELTVTADSSGARPPTPDVELTLSNYEIATSGEPAAGERTVAVHAEDAPEGFMMHDINLVRLDEGTSVDDVVAWMDWMDLERFRAPAPGHSLGGVEHMAPGRTGYLTVDFVPGRYAWVSEGYGARGMVEEFTVE